jgi:hypothetical protein
MEDSGEPSKMIEAYLGIIAGLLFINCFAQFANAGKGEEFTQTYHRGPQIVSAIINFILGLLALMFAWRIIQ